jgi:hypothetical protein
MKTVALWQKHKNYSIYGVQFHPERGMTYRKTMLKNFCYVIMKEILNELFEHKKRFCESSYDIPTAITAGEVNDSQIAAFLPFMGAV